MYRKYLQVQLDGVVFFFHFERERGGGVPRSEIEIDSSNDAGLRSVCCALLGCMDEYGTPVWVLPHSYSTLLCSMLASGDTMALLPCAS